MALAEMPESGFLSEREQVKTNSKISMTFIIEYLKVNKIYSWQHFIYSTQVIGQLERGTVISKFYYRKRPERKMLAVRRETMFVVWYRVSSSRNMYEVIKAIPKTTPIRE